MYICSEVNTTSRYIHYSTITTMIIINDPLRLLNLNPLAIYLMLTPEENAQYGDKLKSLNRYSTLTKGIFHFDIVEKGETPYDKLPKEMIRNMSHFNVMVRLVNFIHGIYRYGLEEIDFKDDMDTIVDKLKVFVDNICKENIDLLDILEIRDSYDSFVSRAYYRERNISINLFKAALNGEVIEKKEGELSLQRISYSPDNETSLGIANLALDNNKERQNSKIEKEYYQNKEPDKRPNIIITVKNVKTGKYLKDGSEKMKLGVELNIDGNIVPVVFGSTDQTFLYIITLLAKLEQREIMRSSFLPVEPYRKDQLHHFGKMSKDIKNWLAKRFQALSFNRRFDEWYLGVKDNPHPLDVAMSGIKQKLWDTLCLEYKDAYYYCIVVNDFHGYDIRIPSSKIRIDPIIMARIS